MIFNKLTNISSSNLVNNKDINNKLKCSQNLTSSSNIVNNSQRNSTKNRFHNSNK